MTIKPTSVLHDLNDAQRKAVTSEAKQTLVVAGPGTGKTRCIVARALYLLEQGVEPEKILIMAFTKKAASEIYDRIIDLASDKAQGIKVVTMHTFALSLIRNPSNGFIEHNYSIADQSDQRQLFNLILAGKGFSLTQREVLDLHSYIVNTQCDLQTAVENKFGYSAADINLLSLRHFFVEYGKRKAKQKFMDFDDLLVILLEGLKQSSPSLIAAINSYSHVLVDEAQDTNSLQWQILHRFTDANLFCVGDPAQAIYGFRGANSEELQLFKQRFPDANIVHLTDNYRSTQSILDFSNWLLNKDTTGFKHDLSANSKDAGLMPHIYSFNSPHEESKWIVEDIAAKYKNGKKLSDIMVIVRSSNVARPIEADLVKAGIDYVFIGGMKLFETAHIKDVLSVLRICINHEDLLAWFMFLKLWQGIGDKKSQALIASIEEATSFSGCIDALEKTKLLPPEAFTLLNLAYNNRNNSYEAIKGVCNALKEILAAKYKKNWRKRKKDLEMVGQLAKKQSCLKTFLDTYLLEPITATQADEDGNADTLKIITVHSAKGTEGDTCYIVNVSPNAYPMQINMFDESKVQEDLRVLYVALTRTKNDLIITRNGNYNWSDFEDGNQLPNGNSSYFLSGLPNSLATHTYHESKDNNANRFFRTPRMPFGLNVVYGGTMF